jgi:hypothetical protein
MSAPMTAADLAEHLRAWQAYQHDALFRPMGLGLLMPQQLAAIAEGERTRFLKADHHAAKCLDVLASQMVHTRATAVSELRRLLDAARAADLVASAHGDNCSYLQAAELAYLRPLVWRNEEWLTHPDK